MYFIFVCQYGRRRINAIFGSDDDSKSNLSLSDVNVDADLSDIEVLDFLRRKAAKVSLKTVKATTTQPQVINAKVSISDVYTSRMGGVDRVDQLRSIYLFGVAVKKGV